MGIHVVSSVYSNMREICSSCLMIVLCISGLVQDCSISIALVMEILKSCPKPSIWYHNIFDFVLLAHGGLFVFWCQIYWVVFLMVKLSISRHWIKARYKIGKWWQQGITWTNVVQNVWCHMTSLGAVELMITAFLLTDNIVCHEWTSILIWLPSGCTFDN